MSNSGLAEKRNTYRIYDENTVDRVAATYRLNHTHQTYEYVLGKEKEYLTLDRMKMGVWQAIEKLNDFVDESDPDTELSQINHLLQTSEAIRQDGHPDWMILAGLIHDLGKVLSFYDEPQWAIVGDTFPVGCKFSDKIIYHEEFFANPDMKDERYNTKLGVYEENCGLKNIHMSWGHDEYLYHIVKDYLPTPALYMIRYHSFYSWHKEGDYTYLMDEEDHEMLEWVKKFNPYDLYSKLPTPPDPVALKPYYEDLISKYFPDQLSW